MRQRIQLSDLEAKLKAVEQTNAGDDTFRISNNFQLQKERIWSNVQSELEQDALRGTSDSVSRRKDIHPSFGNLGRSGKSSRPPSGKPLPQSYVRKKLRTLVPVIASVAALVIAGGLFAQIKSGAGLFHISRFFGTQRAEHFGSLTITNTSKAAASPQVPQGFQQTPISTLGVTSPSYASTRQSMASPDGRWLAVFKPGSGTFLENMKGQEIKVSSQRLIIEGSTPTGAVVMQKYGGNTVLAYLPYKTAPHPPQSAPAKTAGQKATMAPGLTSSRGANASAASTSHGTPLTKGQVIYFPLSVNRSSTSRQHGHNSAAGESIQKSGGSAQAAQTSLNNKSTPARQSAASTLSTVWAKQSIGGNWATRVWSKSQTFVNINGKPVSALADALEVTWSPRNGNVLAAVLPTKSSHPSAHAFQNCSIVTYNIKTQKLHTIAKGVPFDVENVRHLIEWSTDGWDLAALTKRGLTAFSPVGSPVQGSGSFPNLHGPHVWLDPYHILAADYKQSSASANSEFATKLSIPAWYSVNAESIQSGPPIQGHIMDIRSAGTGRALVQTSTGLWLVNLGKSMEVLHRDPESWWYDTNNGTLYVMLSGSSHVYQKSLQGILTGGGNG